MNESDEKFSSVTTFLKLCIKNISNNDQPLDILCNAQDLKDWRIIARKNQKVPAPSHFAEGGQLENSDKI